MKKKSIYFLPILLIIVKSGLVLQEVIADLW